MEFRFSTRPDVWEAKRYIIGSGRAAYRITAKVTNTCDVLVLVFASEYLKRGNALTHPTIRPNKHRAFTTNLFSSTLNPIYT